MANGEEHLGDPDSPFDWAAGYRSRREPKLRGTAADEAEWAGLGADDGCEPADFGAAPEDGLRMLAALGTMSSLEPDYVGDLEPDEASVTFIEQVPASGEAASLQERLEAISAALDRPADEPEAAAFGPAEEATIEIFELGEVETEAEAALARYRLLKEIAGGER